ncbi:MAG: murein biosynthesis integral membrane protein MurJ [Pseudomonadota bacterium]
MMKGSLYKKVGIASLIMMSSVFLSRIIGLLREVFIAYVGGASGEVDAYQMAFVLPEILNHVAATGFLSITFIPIFNKYLVRNREEEGWKVFSIIFSFFGTLLLVLILLAWFWTDGLVDLIAPGVHDPVIRALTIRMTRIVLPAQFFFFAGGLFMAVQFSKERFFLPALAPLLYNLGIILGGLLLAPWVGIEGFAWGVLGGAVVGNFVLQWIGARRVGMHFTFSLEFSHPDIKRYLFLTLPLILGLTMTFSTEFFFRFFGSYMPRGTIAALNYGLRVMFILVGIFGQAVGTASYPFMSRLVAEGRIDEMNRLMNRTLCYLSLVIPFSTLLMVLRHEVVVILFQRGRFDAAATELTSHLLPFLLLGAFAFSAQTVVVRGYYAMQNTLFPALLGTAAVLLSIPFYMVGVAQMGSAGVALGVSLAALLQVVVLYVLWNRRSGNRESREVYARVGKIICLSVFLGLVLEGLRRAILSGIDPYKMSGALLIGLVLGPIFLLLLYLGGRVMRIEEILEILSLPLRKVKNHIAA